MRSFPIFIPPDVVLAKKISVSPFRTSRDHTIPYSLPVQTDLDQLGAENSPEEGVVVVVVVVVVVATVAVVVVVVVEGAGVGAGVGATGATYVWPRHASTNP